MTTEQQTPATLIRMARDWQAIAQRQGLEELGSPEGADKLAEAKRYGVLADALAALATSAAGEPDCVTLARLLDGVQAIRDRLPYASPHRRAMNAAVDRLNVVASKLTTGDPIPAKELPAEPGAEAKALALLTGLHPEVTIDDPMEMATRIFDHVMAERAEWAREKANLLSNIELRDRVYRAAQPAPERAQVHGAAQDSRSAAKVGGSRPSPVAAPPTEQEGTEA